MAIEWSGLSPELLVRLDRSAGQPLRAQLEASLRDAIRGGRLRAGERLPSSRELARELGVSRGMVQDCYAQLLSEGYLTSRTGSATRSKTPATAPRSKTKRSARSWPWACASATCRSTSKASWSPDWRPAAPRRSWSPRLTRLPPEWSCPRPGGTP